MILPDLMPKHSFVYDGAQVNIYHANKGEGLARHEHLYAHATFCMSGSCYIKKENKQVLIDKNSKPINLVENEWHEIEAAEDGTVFCNLFSKDKY